MVDTFSWCKSKQKFQYYQGKPIKRFVSPKSANHNFVFGR